MDCTMHVGCSRNTWKVIIETLQLQLAISSSACLLYVYLIQVKVKILTQPPRRVCCNTKGCRCGANLWYFHVKVSY